MSEPLAPRHGPQPEEIAQAPPTTVASRFDVWQRAGGIAVPVITALVAFFIGGLLVLATGHDPFQAYWDIVKGAGLNWLAHPTNTDVANTAAYNFSQTLLQTTSLILTGLAVAFAFRCGLFNIGGNGQYLMGLFVANWVGVSFVNMSRPAHVLVGIALATAAGAAWAAIAGFLKARFGAHEVITTIMLNWIAYWIGNYLFQQGGPLQGAANKPLDIPISGNVVESAKLPVFWGDPALQGLHIGFFVAIGALVVFWLIRKHTLSCSLRSAPPEPPSPMSWPAPPSPASPAAPSIPAAPPPALPPTVEPAVSLGRPELPPSVRESGTPPTPPPALFEPPQSRQLDRGGSLRSRASSQPHALTQSTTPRHARSQNRQRRHNRSLRLRCHLRRCLPRK